MRYRRSSIEVESPEELGYSTIKYNLAESSICDARLGDLNLDLKHLVLAYTEHRGKTALREVLAEQYGVTVDDILLAPGAAAGLFMVNSALLGPESSIVVVRPNYTTNIEVPRLLPCSVICLDLIFEEQYRLDLAKVEALIRPGTRLVSVTYPHNPSGAVISEKDLHELVQIAERHNCYLLVDETYRDLHRGTMPPLAAAISPHAISVSSMSKAYGMPGIRVGWIVTRDPELQRMLLAAKEQIFLCGSVVDEEIALSVLQMRDRLLPQIRQQVDRNWQAVKEWMDRQTALEWVLPGGGVVCLPRIKQDVAVDPAVFYATLLDQFSTYVGPGHWFELSDRNFRLGFGWEPFEKLTEGLANISRALEAAMKPSRTSRTAGA
ncbi:MAG: pyridoxal phosphate-dependent aminotransferase [Terriglobales bacterium]